MTNKNFDVTISVGGRFYAFYLANELNKKGYLKQLITSYPKFETQKYGIPRDKISSVIIKEILQRGWGKLPSKIAKIVDPTFFINNIFDYIAKTKIKRSSIFFCWPTKSLHSLRKAKQMGSIVVLEHGSSHIIEGNKILSEEYKKFGISVKKLNSKITEKVLKEFEEADYIYVPSSFVENSFIKQGIPKDKLFKIPFGVDLSEFRQVPKEDNVFRVIFAGGMILRKGVHYLLQAFTELNLPNSELMLIGSISNEIKPFFKKYEVENVTNQQIKKSLNQNSSRIRFLGHKKQKELHKYYSQGSVFAIMSIEEGLALVQPQAMACGLPVICTTNTGGGDIVRDGKDGFVIPIRDMDTLKEKLTYLYENRDECKQMGQSAKKRIEDNFTWERFGDKIIEEFQRIIKENT